MVGTRCERSVLERRERSVDMREPSVDMRERSLRERSVLKSWGCTGWLTAIWSAWEEMMATRGL